MSKVQNEQLTEPQQHLAQDKVKEILGKLDNQKRILTNALCPEIERRADEKLGQGTAGKALKPMDVGSVMNPMDGYKAHNFQEMHLLRLNPSNLHEIHPLRLNPTNDHKAHTFYSTDDDMEELERNPDLEYPIGDQAAPKLHKHPFIRLPPDDMTKSKFPKFSISKPKPREEGKLPQSTVGTGLDDPTDQMLKKIINETCESSKLRAETAFMPLRAELRETMDKEAIEKRAKAIQDHHVRKALRKEHKVLQSTGTNQGFTGQERAMLNSLLIETMDLANEDTMDRSKLLSKLFQMIDMVNNETPMVLLAEELGLSIGNADAPKHHASLGKAMDAWTEERSAPLDDHVEWSRADPSIADVLWGTGVHPPMTIPEGVFLRNMELHTPLSLRGKAKKPKMFSVSDATQGDIAIANQDKEDQGFVVV
ncbi:hypothetical protein MMC14_002517 [Varicellaria rhodocarpa]|nr:hypothetical protein [Varicellaria rhodocarpa]